VALEVSLPRSPEPATCTVHALRQANPAHILVFRFWVRSQNWEKRLFASSCLSARPSVRMEQFGFHWTDFHETWYLSILPKSVDKIEVSLTFDKNNGYVYFAWRPAYFMICRWILFRMRNVSHKICREYQDTYFMFNNYFQKLCRVWDNVEKYDRAIQPTDDNIVRRFILHTGYLMLQTHTHNMWYSLLFHSNNGCTNCYVLLTLPVLLRL